METNFKLQILRNDIVASSANQALRTIKDKLITDNNIKYGELILTSYQIDNNTQGAYLGVKLLDGYQIFEGCRIDSDGELIIPTTVETAIQTVLTTLKDTIESLNNTVAVDDTVNSGVITAIEQVGGKLVDATTRSITGDGVIAVENYGIKLKYDNKTLVSENDELKVNNDALKAYTAGDGIKETFSKENNKVTFSATAKKGDKIISVSEEGIKSTLKLIYDETNKEIKLLGVDDDTIGEAIPTADFVVDGFLKSVKLEGDNLIFTWNTDSKITETTINLDKYIDVYKAGEGIAIDGNIVKAKLAETDGGLMFDNVGGIKVNVDPEDNIIKIDENNNALSTSTFFENLSDTLGTIEEALATLNATEIAASTISEKDENGNDIENGKQITAENVQEALQRLFEVILANEHVAQAAFKALTTVLGDASLDDDGKIIYNGSGLLSDVTSFTDADMKLASKIAVLEEYNAIDGGSF